MNIISLFSGCGGLDLGFEKQGLISRLQMNLIQKYMKHLRLITRKHILLRAMFGK